MRNYGSEVQDNYAAGGVRNMATALRNARIKEGEMVLLVFDMAAAAQAQQLVEVMVSYVKRFSCDFYVTQYYCFEEMMLSYSSLAEFGQCKDGVILKLLKLARAEIQVSTRHGAYFEDEAFDNFKRENNTRNREHLAKQLLAAATISSGERFKITQRVFGDCWLTDCRVERNKDGRDAYFCVRCPLKDKEFTALLKLEHFQKHSIMNATPIFRKQLNVAVTF
jgi:hypothetical protein